MRIFPQFSWAISQPVMDLGVSLFSDRTPAPRKVRSCSSSIATGENCHIQLQLTPLHLLNANESALLSRTHSEGHQSQREPVSKPRPMSDPWTERLTQPKAYLKNCSYQFTTCQCLKLLSSMRLKIQILGGFKLSKCLLHINTIYEITAFSQKKLGYYTHRIYF